mgnify:CR=1 FL=1
MAELWVVDAVYVDNALTDLKLARSPAERRAVLRQLVRNVRASDRIIALETDLTHQRHSSAFADCSYNYHPGKTHSRDA